MPRSLPSVPGAVATPALLVQAATAMQPTRDRHATAPIYQRWWFWAAIGVVVADGVVNLMAATSPRLPTVPADAPEFHPFK